MGGLNSLCAQYMKAVFARAKADLLGEFATIGRRDLIRTGKYGNPCGVTAEASVAIRRMKGLKRATVKKV
ncbi:head completion/stabilization protein [Escherichia coli]